LRAAEKGRVAQVAGIAGPPQPPPPGLRGVRSPSLLAGAASSGLLGGRALLTLSRVVEGVASPPPPAGRRGFVRASGGGGVSPGRRSLEEPPPPPGLKVPSPKFVRCCRERAEPPPVWRRLSEEGMRRLRPGSGPPYRALPSIPLRFGRGGRAQGKPPLWPRGRVGGPPHRGGVWQKMLHLCPPKGIEGIPL